VKLGKLLYLFDNIISRICNYNIDKYVLESDQSIASAKDAMLWLYVDSMDARLLDFLDVERFFNFIRLLITKDVQSENTSMDEASVDTRHSKIKENLYQSSNPGGTKDKSLTVSSTETLRTYLKSFKNNTRDTLSKTFYVYNELNIFWQYLQNCESYTEITEDLEGIEQILFLAQTLKQILTQQLSAYMKLNSLEVPHSELDNSCFKHSDLSEGNFINSIFCNSQLNNTVWKNCNLSICNLKQCSAKNSDFSGSNFNYSNLTGVNFSNSILNDAQLTSVALRDPMIDTYTDYIKTMIKGVYGEDALDHPDEINEIENYIIRIKKVLEDEGGRESIEYKDIYRGEKIRSEFIKKLADKAQSNKSLSWLWLPAAAQDTDDTVHILLTDPNGSILCADDKEVKGTVLDGALEKLTEVMKNFLEYHKNRVIDPDMLNKLGCFAGKEDKEHKKMREAKYGKICFQTASLREVSANRILLPKTDLSFVDATDCSMDSSDISEALVHHGEMRKAYFGNANLNKADFYCSDMGNANFNHAKMMDAVILDSNLANVDFSSATLIKTMIINSACDKPYLNSLLKPFEKRPELYLFDNYDDARTEDDTETEDANSIQQKNDNTMRDSNWTNANANDITLIGLDMDRSHFEQAQLKSSLIFNCLSRWSFFDNTDLAYAILMGISFHQSSMQSIILSKACIYACEFTGCRMSSASLIGASLDKVFFFDVGMSDVNMSHADFRNCSIRDVNFSNINITNTKFTNTVFDNIDFGSCIGLENAKFENCIFLRMGYEGSEQKIELKTSGEHKQSIPLKRGKQDKAKQTFRYSTI
jgi:uncharacterized protein YjbI with pentapeptide repeats